MSNRKDIRNAVEAMNSAQAWSHSTAHLRAQILYYMAENLSARKAEFVKTLQTLTGNSGSENEVEFSIQRLFFYAAWADKFDGSARNVPVKAIALVMNEPIGNCGVICDDKYLYLDLYQQWRLYSPLEIDRLLFLQSFFPGCYRLLSSLRYLRRSSRVC